MVLLPKGQGPRHLEPPSCPRLPGEAARPIYLLLSKQLSGKINSF